MPQPKVIPNKKGLTAYEKWEAPVVEEEPPIPEELVTAAEIEAIQQLAYTEGYAQGYEIGVDQGNKDGFAAGHGKLENLLTGRLNRLDSVLKFISRPLSELDEEVVSQLSDMSILIAKQLIRRELHTDPGQVIAVVREAMSALPANTRQTQIFLHPEDAELVREVFVISDEREQSWKLTEDPSLTRGGCRIEAEHSRIDASVEHRMNQIIATILGGERERDQGQEHD
ncbi:MAG: flagellar assembly protein FliH [Gammaproteobacteria bacterium]|nr:flagellar assembly protein FliH [Gammaproteobacteria bacterium]